MSLAVITGASTGIGLELARLCAAGSHTVLVAADEPAIHPVALASNGEAAEVDLATRDGVETLLAIVAVVTNIMGTLRLVHPIARGMAQRGTGRILIIGSIAGFMPGTFQAVYNASKAFLDSFAMALAHELKGSSVTVTCLMPGPTDTEFFRRAGMADTPIGRSPKDDPAWVARIGFDAMMEGREQITPGLRNKLQSAAAEVLPAGMIAQMHRHIANPEG